MSDKPLRIAGLFFGSLEQVGGSEIFAHNLFARLVRRGHQVHVYGPWLPGAERARVQRGRPYVLHQILPRGWAGKAAFVLRGLLQGHARLYGHELWQVIGAYPAGHLASKGLPGPVVLCSHGSDLVVVRELDYGTRRNPKHDRRIRRAVPRMDRVVAVSPTIAEEYRKLGVDEDRIVHIPNGIDIDRLRQPVDEATVRQTWALPLEVPVLVTAARFNPVKGLGAIPVAAALLRDRGHSFRWLVVGPGMEGLEPAIRKAGVEGLVQAEPGIEPDPHIPGELDAPPRRLVELYRAADIFVAPSLREAFGRVLVEAMAAGTPVVTTDAPGCRDVVTHERNGLAARSGDAESLADQIERLLLDPSLARRLADRASSDVQRYDWDRVLDAYEALYRELLGSESGR